MCANHTVMGKQMCPYLASGAQSTMHIDFSMIIAIIILVNHGDLQVCAVGKPMCLLFEFMGRGDLSNYLRFLIIVIAIIIIIIIIIFIIIVIKI